jgi:hypothetical protein
MSRKLHRNAAATDQHYPQALCRITLECCSEIQDRLLVSNGDNVGVGWQGQTPRHGTAGNQQPSIPDL